MALISRGSEVARETACAMLRAWDIDPNMVTEDGVTHEGYYTFAQDSKGRKVIQGDVAVTEHHLWPEWFPTYEFLELVSIMNGARI